MNNDGIFCFVVLLRVLRQEDYIFPYLFIMIADTFYTMLNKVSSKRHIHEAKASHIGPKISHLLFADDNLLFARANRQDCTKIVDILNKYETASSQRDLLC